MFSRDRWQEILEVLGSNIFRTLLTAFGVFWGIYILILLLAAGKGLENGVKADFSGVATNTMFMWAETTTMAYAGFPEGRDFKFPPFRCPGHQGQGATPTDGFPEEHQSASGQCGQCRLRNQHWVLPSIRGLSRNPLAELHEHRERTVHQLFPISNPVVMVAVIGEGVRQELFEEGEDPLGKIIRADGVNFMVVGTYRDKTSGNGQSNEKNIFVPFTAFSQAFNQADRVGWMAITAEDGHSITELSDKILATVKEARKIHPEDERAIGYFDLFKQYNRVESLFNAIQWVAIVVGIMVLLSGIIGVSNIMLIVVKERTKEIGIRRALGEHPWSIRKQILMESIVLTIVSGMTGIIAGALTIFGINALLDANGPVDMFLNPSVSVGLVSIALIILVIAGLLAGFIPAQSAIRVRPIEALRTE